MKNYEEKYRKALYVIETIKKANKDNTELVNFIDYNYPELQEIEDEKIRKDIIEYLKLAGKGDGDYAQPTIDKWIAYLEKQGEQKPVDMNNVSIQRMVANYSNTDEYDEDGNSKGKPLLCMVRAYEQGIRDILNLVKQTNLNEWSEEDEKMLKLILSDIETIRNNATVEQYIDVCNNKIEWLKSLKPQSHRKSS